MPSTARGPFLNSRTSPSASIVFGRSTGVRLPADFDRRSKPLLAQGRAWRLGPRAQEREDGVHAAVLRRVRGQVELAEDAAYVGLDGLRRDVEQLRDPAVGSPFGQEREHLALPL